MMENGFESKENTFSSVDTLSSFKNDRKKEDSVKSESRKGEQTMKDKHLTGFFKNSFKTLTMPRKAAPERDKNEPSRFLGEGVTFKAKLIGVLEVEEARGDRMCQEALLELKTAVRAAGEHKQRINIVIAIDGIRLREEKTGDCLHHHPVHKISFIAQDVADSRAFGYIFGSPDTSHRFFGIKTDKAASQVVMAMRDLFQAVYELKKREVEMAKQNIEQHQLKYGSSFYLDSGQTSSSSKNTTNTDQIPRLKQVPREETNKNTKNKTQTTSVIADLMDLELELNSLQQGLSQMERLTPSDPFGPSPSLTKEDPFGDSFTPPPCITTPPPAKLPPPPASGERRKVGSSTSSAASQPELHWFDKETQDLFNSEKSLGSTKEDNEERDPNDAKSVSSSRDLYDIFVELDPLGTGRSKPYTDKKDFFQELKNPPKKQLRDLRGRETDAGYLGTSSKGSYPEEGEKMYEDSHIRKYRSIDSDQRITLAEELAKREDASSDPFETSFANFASFDGIASRSPANFSALPRRSPQSNLRQQSPPIHSETHAYGLGASTLRSSSNSSKSVYKSLTSGDDADSPSSQTNDICSTYSTHRRNQPQWGRLHEDTSKQKIVIDLRKVLSNMDDTDKENDSPVAEEGITLRSADILSPGTGGNVSSDSFESIPEPPPRPITSPVISQPPPLPPKKLQLPVTLKPPPPRSSAETTSHYDYIENYESVGSRQTLRNGDVQIPPLPAPARKPKFSHHEYGHRDFARDRPQKQHSASSIASAESDYYLTPISKCSRLEKQEGERGGGGGGGGGSSSSSVKHSKPSLNITISQLTSSGFEDLASILRIPASALSKMTLKELTECLSRLTEAECQKLERDMSRRNRGREEMAGPKYRSMNESFDEDVSSPASSFKVNFDEKFPPQSNPTAAACPSSAPPQVDKYAVFRELIDQDQMSLFSTASLESGDGNEQKQSTKLENNSGSEKNVDCGEGPARNDRYDSPKSSEGKDDGRKEDENDVTRLERDTTAETECPVSIPRAVDSSGVVSDSSSPVGKQSSKADQVPENSATAVEQNSDIEKRSADDVIPETGRQSTTEQETRKSDEKKNDEAEKEEGNREGVPPSAHTGVGKNWAIFDSEQDTKERDPKDDSLWRSAAATKETNSKTRYLKCKRPISSRTSWREYDNEDDEEEEDDYRGEDGDELIQAEDEDNELEDDANDDDYGDDSEENWQGSKRSLASSWDESSWRENGWSDRDSLYDEGDISPAARYREEQYPAKKRGYQRRYQQPHHKKPANQSPWDEDSGGGWAAGPRRRNAPPYREYVDGERVYESRKILTPERKRYDPKEEDELILLKMMLGKKRLKALEEQLFKHYHEHLSEKAGIQPNSKRYSSKTKGSSSSLFDRQYDELGAGSKGTTVRRPGKKYYHAQMRPKSAEKGSRPLLSRGAEGKEELYVSNPKAHYRKPASQDELSISEEEKWISRASPTAAAAAAAAAPFKNVQARSRQHSQNSPFEDNFALTKFSPESAAAAEDHRPANTSTTTLATATSSLSAASSLRSKNALPARYSSTSKTLTGTSAYASCDNLKYGRSSRDSSQRQSPFEDDFTPSDVQREETRQNDDVFFGNGVPSPASNVGMSTSSAVEPSNLRKGRSARSGGRSDQSRRTASETSHSTNKYYENVELWKKKSPSDVYCTMKERHKKEMEPVVASPKKGKRVGGGGGGGSETSKRHDPFNDYESRTVPRFGQKVNKNKTRNANYDSDSDSTEPGADASAFSDQHSRK